MSLQPAKTTTFTTLMPLQPSQATCSSTSLAHIAMCWIYHCSSVANRDSIRECGLRPNVARVLALKDHRSLLMVMDSCCIFVQLWTSCNPHAKEYSWIQLLLPRPRSFIRLLRVHWRAGEKDWRVALWKIWFWRLEDANAAECYCRGAPSLGRDVAVQRDPRSTRDRPVGASDLVLMVFLRSGLTGCQGRQFWRTQSGCSMKCPNATPFPAVDSSVSLTAITLKYTWQSSHDTLWTHPAYPPNRLPFPYLSGRCDIIRPCFMLFASNLDMFCVDSH